MTRIRITRTLTLIARTDHSRQVVTTPGCHSGDRSSIPTMTTNFVRGCGEAFVRPRDTTVPKVGSAGEPFVSPFPTTIPNYNTAPLQFVPGLRHLLRNPSDLRMSSFLAPMAERRPDGVRVAQDPLSGRLSRKYSPRDYSPTRPQPIQRDRTRAVPSPQQRAVEGDGNAVAPLTLLLGFPSVPLDSQDHEMRAAKTNTTQPGLDPGTAVSIG